MSTKQLFTVLSPRQTIASAGTPERLVSSAKRVEGCLIENPATNTGDIYIMDTNSPGTNKHTLAPGDTLSIDARQRMAATFDLMDIWVDAEVSAEGPVVSYLEDQ